MRLWRRTRLPFAKDFPPRQLPCQIHISPPHKPGTTMIAGSTTHSKFTALLADILVPPVFTSILSKSILDIQTSCAKDAETTIVTLLMSGPNQEPVSSHTLLHRPDIDINSPLYPSKCPNHLTRPRMPCIRLSPSSANYLRNCGSRYGSILRKLAGR